MKTLYFECSSGAAGDMLSASLFELISDKDEFINKLNDLFAPEIVFGAEKVSKNNVIGTHLHVKIHNHEEGEEHHEHHHHRNFKDIERIITSLDISDGVKNNALSVYKIICDAESRVHGMKVEEVHLHEVGALDAIADITAFCLLMEKISAERVVVSPINVGFGTVKAAHGILPVPAPATAIILENMPIYTNNISGELCTPTGAALLKFFADEYSYMPKMTVQKAGYGFGKKDLEVLNCVRSFIGEDEKSEQINELEFNIDDMTAEEIAFACERILKGGAKDVFTAPIGMKKSRLGTKITVLCSTEDKEKMLALIFKHTTTLGVREALCERYTLKRIMECISTPYGDVHIKKSEGFGSEKAKAEFEDVAKIAIEKDISFREAKELLR
ncbi:MAG: nickel pincer cofactor biosynthesis protein LarC [Eubacterium sp.]|nr:nickel pincer cofactor biosynthesis protein LarC [Eubacterium sp.]